MEAPKATHTIELTEEQLITLELLLQKTHRDLTADSEALVKLRDNHGFTVDASLRNNAYRVKQLEKLMWGCGVTPAQ